jgi:GT2 family glycosyltransferase
VERPIQAGPGLVAPVPIRRVRAVVVDYGGGSLTLRCLRALAATEWRGHLEIVLVDNDSPEPVTDQARAGLPSVRIVVSDRNRGFAGGANLGMGDLDGVDAVALVNNDAVVDPHWLDDLAAALDGDDRLGAASPKMVLTNRWLTLAVESPVRPVGGLDRRPVGVQLRAAGPGKVVLAEGFWGPERDALGRFQWTQGTARMLVAVPAAPDAGDTSTTVTVELSAPRPCTVTLDGGAGPAEVAVGRRPCRVPVTVSGQPHRLINNAGTQLRPDWYGVDRGLHAVDDGTWDAPGEVTAWCGGAVLLRAGYLRDVGRFDDRLFLYYEDLDLSLRGAARGWRYRYEPASVVGHEHGATAVAGSPLAEYYKERNRLLVAARHAPAAVAARLVGRFALATISYARRDLVAPVLRGHRPVGEVVWTRVRSLVGFVRLASAFRRSGPGRKEPGRETGSLSRRHEHRALGRDGVRRARR